MINESFRLAESTPPTPPQPPPHTLFLLHFFSIFLFIYVLVYFVLLIELRLIFDTRGGAAASLKSCCGSATAAA